MSPEDRFDRYADYWIELNAVNALITELEKRREDIKAKQRGLANAMVKEKLAEMKQPEGS